MRIRSVTVFYAHDGGREAMLRELEEVLPKIVEHSSRYNPMSVRLSLPPSSSLDVDLVAEVKSVASKFGVGLVAAAHILDERPRVKVEDLVKAIRVGSYASLWGGKNAVNEEVLDLYVRVLKELRRAGEGVLGMRIGLLFGEILQTPYYPISMQLKDGVGLGLALLYPEDLLRQSPDDVETRLKVLFERAYNIGKEVAEACGVEFYGVDYSLSPWNDESVVAVIERHWNVVFGSVGTFAAIKRLNELIGAASRSYKPMGFNEVMLPVAEDSRLKDRIEGGLVDVYKLSYYTLACVAGLDAVPLSVEDQRSLIELLKDLHCHSVIKGRSLGVRLMLVDGDWVEVPRFGRTPVLKL